MIVHLKPEDIAEAKAKGAARDDFARDAGLLDAHGLSRSEGRRRHEQGALAEKAVSVALGLPWDGSVGVVGGPDVGTLQVRSTRLREGSLILHPTDRDEDRFVLVIVTEPSALLAGWISGRDGKREAFWRTGGVRSPAFFVPRWRLQPMKDLPR